MLQRGLDRLVGQKLLVRVAPEVELGDVSPGGVRVAPGREHHGHHEVRREDPLGLEDLNLGHVEVGDRGVGECVEHSGGAEVGTAGQARACEAPLKLRAVLLA